MPDVWKTIKWSLPFASVPSKGKPDCHDGKLIAQGQMKSFFLLTADTDYKLNLTRTLKTRKPYVGTDPNRPLLPWWILPPAKSYQMSYYERHKADYTNLFNRVKLTLNPHAPMTLVSGSYPICPPTNVWPVTVKAIPTINWKKFIISSAVTCW